MTPYNEDFHKNRTGPTLAADYKEAKRVIGDDDQWVVWPARIDRDVCELGLTYEASLAKHRAEWRVALGLPSLFPPAPTRKALLRGQTRQQGRMVTLQRFGTFPWWGACWLWLTSEERALVAAQLLAGGDRICLIQSALDGKALYDEPNQFYSADKFGPLTLSIDQHVAAVEEAILLGFDGAWIFLDGDDGAAGYPIAVAQTQLMGPALAASKFGNLNDYTVQLPGWDGVWHHPEGGGGTGYSREQMASFAEAAHAAGARYVGAEHATGYLLAGKGADDYAPGGVMHGYQLILGEFDSGVFDDTVWQILPRMQPRYVRDPLQPPPDDPHPPFDLGGPSSDGEPPEYRVFEFDIYVFVRGELSADVERDRQRFEAMGSTEVC